MSLGREHLSESHGLYRRAYEKAIADDSADGVVYAGINTATTALLLGDESYALETASHVADVCRAKIEEKPDYWSMATLGECHLLARDFEKASEDYAAAVQLAGNQIANIASSRRNAEIILRHQKADLSLLDKCFVIPSVAIFSGHLIDRRNAEKARFPESRIEFVRQRLQTYFEEANIGFGYASAARGGDLLFLDELEQSNGKTYVVLPVAEKPFVDTSVAIDSQTDWTPLFATAMAGASQVIVLDRLTNAAEPLHFEYANRVMTGLAILHARSLGTRVKPIAVWDRKPAPVSYTHLTLPTTPYV